MKTVKEAKGLVNEFAIFLKNSSAEDKKNLENILKGCNIVIETQKQQKAS